MLAFVTMLCPEFVSALAKNCHGNIAAKTMIAYGASPTEGSPATRPKTTVMINMLKNGWKSAQAAPATVWR